MTETIQIFRRTMLFGGVLILFGITTSCTFMRTVPKRQVVKSHDAVMRDFKTKELVYSKFGPPDRVVQDAEDGSILIYGSGNRFLNFYCQPNGLVYQYRSKNYDFGEYKTVYVQEKRDYSPVWAYTLAILLGAVMAFFIGSL